MEAMIGWMRSEGMTLIDAVCACGHEASVPIEGFPDGAEVPDLRFHLRCSQCGRRPNLTVPDWRDYWASGMGKKSAGK